MSLSSRFLAPIIAAVVTAAAIIGFLAWHLSRSTRIVRENPGNGRLAQDEEWFAEAEIGSDGADRSLTALRRGDVATLRGKWAEAEREYAAAVSDGGGLPALRKLAGAQLQRRKVDELRKTIKSLRSAGAREEDLILIEVLVTLRTGDLSSAAAALDAAAESPQKHYGKLLYAVITADHERARGEAQQVLGGWEPVLRQNAGRIIEAYDAYALFPESPPLHRTTLLAQALAEVQECELALPMLVPVLQEQEDYRDAWLLQGYCELVTERSAQALHSLERAYNLDPEKPETQYFLGRAYEDIGDPSNAVIFFQYAVQNGFEPKREARLALALAALAANRPELALEQYRFLSEDAEGDLHIVGQFIALAHTLGKNDDALGAAQKAAVRWPNDALAHELLGDALAALGRVADARTAYANALSIDPLRERVSEKLKKL